VLRAQKRDTDYVSSAGLQMEPCVTVFGVEPRGRLTRVVEKGREFIAAFRKV
jgi:hypothetical protein